MKSVVCNNAKTFTKAKSFSGCGSVWGRSRAPPAADTARDKEWRNKEYREVNNERDDYIATGRARPSGKRSSDGSSKKQKPP
jgi:hypothetical protein